MKQMKKFPMVLSLGLAALLAGCPGVQPEPTPEPGPEPTPEPEPVVEEGFTGIKSLIGADSAKRTEILGTLEKYAVDNVITGLPLFENGGLAMYNPRVTKGTETYISGYGFGILREGELTADLIHEEVVKPSYYNIYDATDPQKINALNDNGSQVGDLYAYQAASYFGTKMNAAKNGYDWYGVLSTEDRPWIVRADGTAAYPEDPEETSDTWRIYVKVGEAGGIKFHTNSELPDRKAFDGKYVELEDYVTAFKVLLTKKFNYYRGAELQKQTGYSAIKGAAAYWNASGTGINDDAFANVGVKSGTDDHGSYLQFTIGAPANRFYAMYGLSSDLYAPINREFFDLVTENGTNSGVYGGYAEDLSTTPVDNILSTGAYTLESWETNKGIAFKRNADWFEVGQGFYKIPGIYMNIWEAAVQSNTYAFEQFLAGKIDACGIPLDYVATYKNDPRTTKTTGTSVFKLNVNSTTQEQWNALFGTNGTIAQLGDNAYEVKPWMSNESFIKGLFFSIDRDNFASKRGSIASINYFSSNYMSDPENGIAYNTTAAHEAALEDFWGDTVATGGYSLSLSQAAFNESIEQLMASGAVKSGDKLEIECWWQSTSNVKSYGNEVAQYIQDSFNNCSKAKENNLTLEFKNSAVDVWSDCYAKHLQVGMFDLGFGSISGNALDPLNFMEVLKSDNSSGFTLNWGVDTSKLDLSYDGATWSYDSLWAAVDHGVVLYKGREVAAASLTNVSAVYDAEIGLTVKGSYKNGRTVMEEKAAAGDEKAAEITAISEDDYLLALDTVFVSLDVGNSGVDCDAYGDVLDTYFDAGADYQLLYAYKEDGTPVYYNYFVGGVEVGALTTDSWTLNKTTGMTFRDEDEEIVSTAEFEFLVTNDNNMAAKFAELGLVAFTLTTAQVINGVESAVSTVVTVPVTLAE